MPFNPLCWWLGQGQCVQFAQLKRRDFIVLFGGAVRWPLAARAQQPEPMRQIAVLTVLPENDPENKARLGGFTQEIEGLGWSEGRAAVNQPILNSGQSTACEITRMRAHARRPKGSRSLPC